jgi:hypothetical protein
MEAFIVLHSCCGSFAIKAVRGRIIRKRLDLNDAKNHQDETDCLLAKNADTESNTGSSAYTSI